LRLGPVRNRRRRPLLVRHREARPRRGAGPPPRAARLHARPAQAGADARLLSRRGRGQRGRSGPRRRARGGPGDPRRRADRVRVALRRPAPGRAADSVLRGSLAMTFERLFVPQAFRDAVADEAWVQAMLDAERALARAQERVGLVPREALGAIEDACRAELYDVGAIVTEGRSAGNPAEPLVRALRSRVSEDAARFVHFGATSQDVLDTAAMLVAGSARTLLLAELDGIASACAFLAETHRSTPMAARTLLQQAVPTTFGLKAAGWLTGALEARTDLAGVRLPAQLGGAAGTLAAVGDAGPAVVQAFAAEVGLDPPGLPWHTRRAPVARLAAALQATAAVCGTIGLDVVLLAQTEVGEVAEAAGGASSTMPHKRNPARAVLARAC